MTADQIEAFRAEAAAAIESGRWERRGCWYQSICLNEVRRSADDVRQSLETLSEVFNPAWAADQNLTGRAHPIFAQLFEVAGLSPFTYIHELAESVQLLRDRGLLGALARRLRDANEFEGAHAEVIALGHWARAGVTVRKQVPSGVGNRNCEWMVSDANGAFCGEVKCINLAPANKELAESVGNGGRPRPYDLAAEGDKMADVARDYACQLPTAYPGLMVISGRDRVASMPFSDQAACRMAARLKDSPECRHLAGILVLRTFLYPEAGVIRLAVLVPNPAGPAINLPLLRRGFPTLHVWQQSTPES